MKARTISLLVGLLAIALFAVPAQAHDATDGSIVIDADDNRLIVTAPVSFDDLGFSDISGDGLLDLGELSSQDTRISESIVANVRDHASLSVNGESIEIVGAGVAGLGGTSSDNPQSSQFVNLVFASATREGDVTEIAIDWGFESPSATVVLSHAGGATTGVLGDTGSISFTLDAWSSAVSFFDLGVEHIQYGTDHLLFLLVLTLAVVGATVTRATAWRTIKLVTAFTVGHALSLGLAYFDVISIPAAVVEPAIALSIVGAAWLAIRDKAHDAVPGSPRSSVSSMDSGSPRA